MEYESGTIHPSECVSEGWELIKNDYGLFFGMSLVLALIVIAVSMLFGSVIGVVAPVLSSSLGVVSGNLPQAGNVSAKNLIPQLIEQTLSIISVLVATLIAAILTCGIYLALSRKSKGETPEFGDFFGGFKFFLPCLIVSGMLTVFDFLINVAILFVGFALGVSNLGAEAIIAPDGRIEPKIFETLFTAIAITALFYLIASFIIGTLTFFIYQLIALKNLPAIDALSQSARAGLRNFLGIIGLFIIQGLMMLGGAVLCGVGILFVLPIIMASNYTAYLRVFGRTTDFGAQHSPPPPPIFGNEADSRFSQF